MKWIKFEDAPAPNINPVSSNKRVVCADIYKYEDELGDEHEIVRWVHVCEGRGINKTFNSEHASLSLDGVVAKWGGSCLLDLTKATHWTVIELPTAYEAGVKSNKGEMK
jgi:hypothetical protein